MLASHGMVGVSPLKRRPGRNSGKEKVTIDDLFFCIAWMDESMLMRIARYYGLMTLGTLINVTLGPKTSLMSVAKLVDLGICRYNGLGIGELVAEILKVAGDDDVRARQAKIGGYDQFYKDFEQWRTEQERFHTWNTDHLSQLLAHHHIDYTRYDGTLYSYVPTIPNLMVQQGVNFMFGTLDYSTTPSPSTSQFGMFGDDHASPSTFRNQDDMHED
ncbi:hypothetical protein Tco_0693115 [Tanacetum coccineum]